MAEGAAADAAADTGTSESFVTGAAAGFLGGACQTFVGQPFDTVKVRMQTSQQPSLFRCAVDTCRNEGIRGLYHGTTPALAFGLIENTFAFGVNEQLKRVLLADNDRKLTLLELAGCGAAGGFAHCFISCPTEVVKCRLQVVGSAYTGPMQCAKATLKEEGVAGLYSGFAPFVLREVPFYLIFFAAYEVLCDKLQQRGGRTRPRDDLTTPELLFAGGFAGCIGWTCVLPSDTVKTQIQTSEGAAGKSFPAACKEVLRTQGVRGFFPGWSAAMLRAFPANAALFFGFEHARRALGWWGAT